MNILEIDPDVLSREASKVDGAADDVEAVSFQEAPALGTSTHAVAKVLEILGSTKDDLAKGLSSTAEEMRTSADDFAETDEAVARGARSAVARASNGS